MNSDVQLAISAEKDFNNEHNLLITFQPKLNENSFKNLHRNVKNVHIIEPEYVPERRYIIELQDTAEVNIVRDAILRSHSEKGHFTVNILDNINNNYHNINPYKLLVENVPLSVTDREIKLLYPLCSHYWTKSVFRNSKSILVHFNNVRDAILGYKITNKINFRSKQLKVEFYRDEDRMSDEFDDEDDTDNEDGISKWEKIEKDFLNQEVSKILYIKNFPPDTTKKDISILFPEAYDFKFISKNGIKSAFIRFRRIEDAIKTYTVSNNIFRSHILHMEFYLKKNKNQDRKSDTICEDNEDIEEIENGRQENNLNVNKSNEEESRNKNIDPSILHVEDLPLEITVKDLTELFPQHQQYQIITDQKNNSSSAYICFNSPFEALQALKDNENKIYKDKILSVKFKSKNLKLNPFALKRKCDTVEENIKRIKTDVDDDEDDVILIGDVPKIHIKMISEDDIDCKSEEEDYADDIYGVDLEVDELDNDNEDNISDDNDFHGVELDDDTVLPLDEDDF